MITNDILGMTIKLVIFLPMILVSIYLIGKIYSKGDIVKGNKMKVIERLQLSKDNTLLIVKVENKYYLMGSSQGKIEILEELDNKTFSKNDSFNTQGNLNMKSLKEIFKLKGEKDENK
ncbi:flagellar biosynthetic protein FliO [Oceanirhabdus sp. W0125-5]|uniref:flagellar biosynthetic protein FliO n=1 Tax=Oceanirhabdus sp. W0125-5 TaxID=2999116 RepID=UPI0022F2F5C4|nr:flagellar biosynthetic protein FliO [Oceanirhabdus sp. W0125-5]WBW95418.1 flagellar biosynthetic protein FliO [Oceanirhabdus sp. W0125-5]